MYNQSYAKLFLSMRDVWEFQDLAHFYIISSFQTSFWILVYVMLRIQPSSDRQ